jgi:hypothetical protein
MQNPSYFIRLAMRCRDLESSATEPELLAQLRIWATELAEMAGPLEVRPVQHNTAEYSASTQPQ